MTHTTVKEAGLLPKAPLRGSDPVRTVSKGFPAMAREGVTGNKTSNHQGQSRAGGKALWSGSPEPRRDGREAAVSEIPE